LFALLDETKIREICLNLIDTAWPVYLTTIDEKEFPQTRAMLSLRNKEKYPKLVPLFDQHRENLMILFTTNTSSTKVADIRKKPAVSVYYCNPDEWMGVMLGGEIEVVEDVELKKELFQPGWENYYPKGYDDPDHTVLRLVPTTVKGWAGSMTFRLELGDSK
jgi:general stress protein 26